ncbi:Protein CBG26135 [Caenorhabditis briggsae]|uniref:Protein CBG26135 n=1 Tax=Caenorhabditis briggsae TaxID=6238 RepID=B6ILI6_CAEBR|nr:Protein CBG26135 [Caenorhabditis briggsae]CAS00766.1 Protein CBG26135 [Caenorhabditis briggsae]
MTRVNDKPIFGQVQIHSGDLIQVGGSPPFVFDSEWMFGTRPNSAKKGAGLPVTVPNGPEKDAPMLPMITGKKIHPQLSLSDSAAAMKKRSEYSRFSKSGPNSESLRSSASSTESRAFYSNPRSIGNNLLQRVVKLQAELMEKDEKVVFIFEILQLFFVFSWL